MKSERRVNHNHNHNHNHNRIEVGTSSREQGAGRRRVVCALRYDCAMVVAYLLPRDLQAEL